MKTATLSQYGGNSPITKALLAKSSLSAFFSTCVDGDGCVRVLRSMCHCWSAPSLHVKPTLYTVRSCQSNEGLVESP